MNCLDYHSICLFKSGVNVCGLSSTCCLTWKTSGKRWIRICCHIKYTTCSVNDQEISLVFIQISESYPMDHWPNEQLGNGQLAQWTNDTGERFIRLLTCANNARPSKRIRFPSDHTNRARTSVDFGMGQHRSLSDY